jgi:hypothetical protein
MGDAKDQMDTITVLLTRCKAHKQYILVKMRELRSLPHSAHYIHEMQRDGLHLFSLQTFFCDLLEIHFDFPEPILAFPSAYLKFPINLESLVVDRVWTR